MAITLFIDDMNRDMLATDLEKLLYDMVVLLNGGGSTTEETNEQTE